MKRIVLYLFFVIAFTASVSAAKDDIEQLLAHAVWKQRVILLFDHPGKPAVGQLELWGNVDFKEWDILPIQVDIHQTALRARYRADETKTTIVLIGKDGLEKWRMQTWVAFEEITDLIDNMPMRQIEKRKK